MDTETCIDFSQEPLHEDEPIQGFQGGEIEQAAPKAEEVLAQVRSIGAERATIALALRNKDAAYAISESLTGEDYQHEGYRAMFQVIKLLVERKLEPTIASVLDSADPYVVERIEKVGGREFLDRMFNFADAFSNLEHWIDEIKSRTATRTTVKGLDTILKRVINMATDSEPDHTAIMGMVEEEVDKLGLAVAGSKTGIEQVCATSSGMSDFEEYHREALMAFENSGGMSGFQTGWEHFDQFIHGFQPGRLYVLAAKYKGGKSLTMTELEKRFGVGRHILGRGENPDEFDFTGGEESGILDLSAPEDFGFRIADLGCNPGPGVIIDTEMRLERDVKPRLLASVAGVEQYMLRDGSWTQNPEYVARIREAHRLINESGIFFAHVNELHRFDLLRATIRAAIHKYGAQWVVFDYIRKPHHVRNASEYEFLGDLTYFLKDEVAEKYNVPVIAGAQLGRGATQQARKREGGRAVSGSDMGGSVKILQAADMVMTLEDYENDENKQKFRIDESRYSAKNGDDNWFEMIRQRDLARFEMGPITSNQEAYDLT